MTFWLWGELHVFLLVFPFRLAYMFLFWHFITIYNECPLYFFSTISFICSGSHVPFQCCCVCARISWTHACIYFYMRIQFYFFSVPFSIVITTDDGFALCQSVTLSFSNSIVAEHMVYHQQLIN